jgi:hypothetical protein
MHADAHSALFLLANNLGRGSTPPSSLCDKVWVPLSEEEASVSLIGHTNAAAPFLLSLIIGHAMQLYVMTRSALPSNFLFQSFLHTQSGTKKEKKPNLFLYARAANATKLPPFQNGKPYARPAYELVPPLPPHDSPAFLKSTNRW